MTFRLPITRDLALVQALIKEFEVHVYPYNEGARLKAHGVRYRWGITPVKIRCTVTDEPQLDKEHKMV